MRVLMFLVIVLAAVFLFNAVQGERTAIVPIRVWKQLVDDPAYQCWILPLEGYRVGVSVFDVQRHPDSQWFSVVSSSGCSGIARLGR